jgi:hypothetical protein
MEKLHFGRITSDELVMLSDEGVEYSIAVDETLRSAIRRASVNSRPDQELPSPRAIQEWVRDGKSIEDICEASGAPADYVSKFAQPVIDELNHIVESAKAVRISLAGDRFSDITQIEFGTLIANRLSAAGANSPAWRSQRIDLGSWQLRIDFHIAGGLGFAIWTFDPRKLVLTPENEAALSLSSTESLHSSVIPKLQPVGPAPEPSEVQTRKTDSDSRPSSSIQETIAAANLKSKLSSATEKMPAESLPGNSGTPETELENSEATKKTHLTVVREDEPAEVVTETGADSESLLNEVRSRRTAAPATHPEGQAESELRQPGAQRPLIPVEEPTPVTTSIRVITEEQAAAHSSLHAPSEDSQLPVVEPEDSIAAEAQQVSETAPEPVSSGPTAVEQPKAETKKGRPGIPSWDEIVFGTKTDD